MSISKLHEPRTTLLALRHIFDISTLEEDRELEAILVDAPDCKSLINGYATNPDKLIKEAFEYSRFDTDAAWQRFKKIAPFA